MSVLMESSRARRTATGDWDGSNGLYDAPGFDVRSDPGSSAGTLINHTTNHLFAQETLQQLQTAQQNR